MGNGQSQTIAQLMRTSLVIAERSQPVYNMQGESAGAVCLLLNRMMGSKDNTQELVKGIRLYLSGIKHHENQLR